MSLLPLVALSLQDTQSAQPGSYSPSSGGERKGNVVMPVSGRKEAPQESWHTSPSRKVASPPPGGQGGARAKGGQNEGSVSPATVFHYWLAGKLLMCVY